MCLRSFPVWLLGKDVEFDCISSSSLHFDLYVLCATFKNISVACQHNAYEKTFQWSSTILVRELSKTLIYDRRSDVLRSRLLPVWPITCFKLWRTRYTLKWWFLIITTTNCRETQKKCIRSYDSTGCNRNIINGNSHIRMQLSYRY